MKASVITWARDKGYNLSVNQEDDEESFFGALGFDGVYPCDEGVFFEGEINDTSCLGYPLLELMSILAPYYLGESHNTDLSLCTFTSDGLHLKAVLINQEVKIKNN